MAALAADPAVDAVIAAPGNPGIDAIALCRDLPSGLLDGDGVADLAVEVGADLVVVGPEAPLVAGVADVVRARGIACFGPGREAAQLEGSKAFAKEVMAAAEVPTALAHVCATDAEVTDALDALGAPYVVKDDGLAAGKGVVVTDDRAEALAHAQRCLAAGSQVVVEEFLDGPEVSLFCLTDGEHVVPLAPAQDFKRIGDGDTGPNTGGMGAYSPLDWAPAGLVDDVVARVAQPTVDEMRRRGTPFAGVLYVGLALTSRGPRVIEFNARFGDPETQVVLARLQTPLGAAAAGRGDRPARPSSGRCAGAPTTRSPSSSPRPATRAPRAPATSSRASLDVGDEAQVLHAGTAFGRRRGRGLRRRAGPRRSSALGADLRRARERAYAALGDDRARRRALPHRHRARRRAWRGDRPGPARRLRGPRPTVAGCGLRNWSP